jgi:hypothetical protein
MSYPLFATIIIGTYLFSVVFSFSLFLFPRKFIDHSLNLQEKFLTIYRIPSRKPLIDPRGETMVFMVRAIAFVMIVVCVLPIACLSYIAFDCAIRGCVVNGNPVEAIWK